ncbi:hypothetical protein GUJ93_ZPchr0007g4882 [Zizania palustris]|uniref:Uncharacterized protein n=1 Tax=Zizania palustris TaxID=103762 RepID=A0A8J5TDZ5_ZIZPA|nr:hypothetical protein GUJ93_ZPchr0007g4882 [Zizania palustris]
MVTQIQTKPANSPLRRGELPPAAMDERLALPTPSAPQSPQFSVPASPYSALHPLLLPSPNPHLLLKPKTLTLSLSSSSLASMPSSSPPAPDAWELVQPTTVVVAAGAAPVDGGLESLDDCAIFPPRLHEGLGVEGEAAAKEAEEEQDEGDFDDDEWLWGWGRCRSAARRAWAAGVGAVREGLLVHGTCGCPAVRPAVWSAAGAAIVVGALLYARRRDRRERDLLVLLSQEKDKRIAQLLHQIALMSDIRGGGEAMKIIKNM